MMHCILYRAVILPIFQKVSIVIKHLKKQMRIGGYALFAHGYHRSTENIDLLIPPGLETGKLIKKALLVLADHSSEQLADEWFDEGENIRLADEVVVDLLFTACGETYDSLKENREIINFDGIDVIALDLYGLLRTKKTVREKDVADRLILEKVIRELEKK